MSHMGPGKCGSAQQSGGNVEWSNAIRDQYSTYEDLERALRAASVESIQCVFGFDFSKSNQWTGERAYQRRSLHDITFVNPYLHTLNVLAPLLCKFDDDGILPAFRFGCAATKDKAVLPLLAPETQDPHFVGMESLKAAYFKAVQTVAMAGPTTFAPMIEKAIEISAAYEHRQLLFLILMTDGDVSNVDLDRRAIIKASNYPISIAALGFGDGPFDKMQLFDDMPGRKFDNFQFVNFTQLEAKSARDENPELTLCTALMQELPGQVKQMRHEGMQV